MIFGLGRKREQAAPEGEATAAVVTGEDVATPVSDDPGEAGEADAQEFGDAEELEEAEEAEDEAGGDGEDAVEIDPRADGPFDIAEVDLGADQVTRVDLGTLIVTPWQGLGLQLQVNEATKQVQALTAVWRNPDSQKESGLEVTLFAAPASGGLADEFREDLVEEAEQAGGSAQLIDGPFGAEVRRVLPQEGPKGEQFFHVSRIWLAEGPRWLLRGILLGEAAVGEADDPKAGPFIEFFRNLVVRRGTKPMVPGELLAMDLPARKEG